MDLSAWERAKELVYSAMKLEPERRRAYVLEHSQDDPSVQQEALSLLEHADDLEDGKGQLSSESGLARDIGHFRLTDLLGEGGMGVVYKAVDTRLDRTVALKALPRLLMEDEHARKRFFREAKAAARINHPNVATVFDILEAGDDLYIVMEYVEGRELRDLIDSGEPLLASDAIRYLVELASGLQAAHQVEVIHRDVKSSNVILTTSSTIKILDFGLARIAGQSSITVKGTTMGTIAYMSPEQALGHPVDLRSDIWSFGVVLYEFLTGSLPFSGADDQAMIRSILGDSPPRLDPTAGEAIGALQQVIDRLLEKSAEARYQALIEVLPDLRGIEGLTGSTQIPLAREPRP
jgi:serine/threonine protein kinase